MRIDDNKRYLRVKVPEITLMFWVIKLWTTGMGEATSDFLGDHSLPIAAAIGIFGSLLALYLQLRQEEYKPPYYWFLVAMIAVVGTMIADAIHDGLSIPYPFTSIGFGIMTAVIFWRWRRSEGTLSIHSVNTRRRELYYWATVFASFALGTALGDMTATSLNLGFFESILLFSAIMLIPLIGWWKLNFNPIFAFWFAYVDTRPIGASFSDWFSKPHNISGLNFGDGRTALIGWIVFLIFVVGVVVTKHGIQVHREHEPHLQPAFAPEVE
jgi:uncharacterized membrane-anchored protein